MTTTVYTIGYSGRNPAEVKKIVDDLGAILFDIRFSPRSRLPQWAGSNVRSLVGTDNYRHMKALGNANYKGDGPVQIVDYQAGRDTIESLDRPVVLMCVCGDASTCHRTTVAEMLRADGFTVTEIDGHYHKPKPAKPAKSTSLISQLTLF